MCVKMTVLPEKTIELKAALLSEGIDFDMDLFSQIDREFYDNQFVYGRTSASVTPQHRFPQVLLLGEEVNTALLRREGSPWNLRVEEDEVQLYREDAFVRILDLPERPAYFGRTLSDGTKSENIIAVAGEDTPGFFFFPECYYFDDAVPCGFCSMKNTRKTVGKEMISEFSEETLRESTRIFQTTPWRDIPLVSITAGTPRTDEETLERIIKPIAVMHDELNPKIPIHVLAHPPENFDLISAYRDAGVTSIAFNLEVYDRQAFEAICPGKAQRYGYDRWIEAMDEARDVFGDYNAYCGLVWGLESPESTMAGNEFIAERRWGIASNIFHADPRSVLGRTPHPSAENIIRIARAQTQIYDTVPEMGTIFSVSMRSTIDWETRRGDLG